MSLVNFAAREITCKIVYYGPGLGGKTTNLEHIYGKVKPETLKAPVEKLTFTAEPDAQKTKHLVLEWQTTKLAIPLK